MDLRARKTILTRRTVLTRLEELREIIEVRADSNRNMEQFEEGYRWAARNLREAATISVQGKSTWFIKGMYNQLYFSLRSFRFADDAR